jgi:hypothetical protein
MAPHRVRSPIVRWSGGLLAGAAMVAAVTGVIALLEPHVPVLSLLVLYVLPIVAVATLLPGRRGRAPLGRGRRRVAPRHP